MMGQPNAPRNHSKSVYSRTRVEENAETMRGTPKCVPTKTITLGSYRVDLLYAVENKFRCGSGYAEKTISVFHNTPQKSKTNSFRTNHLRKEGITTNRRRYWVQWSRRSLPYRMHQSQTVRTLHSYYMTQPREGRGVTPEDAAAETSTRHPCRRVCQALETLRNNSKFSTRQQGVLVLPGIRGHSRV